jgi:excisionase family DNA binding protein
MPGTTSTRVAYRDPEPHPEPPSRGEWVGIPELAEHLGVGRNTIRRHVEAGRIPFIRVGRQYRFRVSEVVAAYRDGTHSAGR